MTASAAGEPLYGREHELQVVASLVGGLAEGVGGTLVVRGEAGIGKSALLAAGAGLAALEVASDAAASSRLLLIADDAQWLDEPSCAVLGFVARRLAAEPVALLIAVRDGLASPFDNAGLPELVLAARPGSTTAATYAICTSPGSMRFRWPWPRTKRAPYESSTGSRA